MGFANSDKGSVLYCGFFEVRTREFMYLVVTVGNTAEPICCETLGRGSVQKGCIHFSLAGTVHAVRHFSISSALPPSMVPLSLYRPSILPPPIVAIANWHLLCARAPYRHIANRFLPLTVSPLPWLEGIHGASEGRRRHKTDHVHKAAS